MPIQYGDNETQRVYYGSTLTPKVYVGGDLKFDLKYKRDFTKDWTLHTDNEHPAGGWSDGVTVWVVDSQDEKVYAYTVSTGARDSDKDIDDTILSTNYVRARGICSDGTTIWIGVNGNESEADDIYAFTKSTLARDSTKDVLNVDESIRGLWTDGTTIWVSTYENDADDRLTAYTISTGSRDTSSDYTLRGVSDSVTDIIVFNNILWTLDGQDARMYAYAYDDGSELDDTFKVATFSSTIFVADDLFYVASSSRTVEAYVADYRTDERKKYDEVVDLGGYAIRGVSGSRDDLNYRVVFEWDALGTAYNQNHETGYPNIAKWSIRTAAAPNNTLKFDRDDQSATSYSDFISSDTYYLYVILPDSEDYLCIELSGSQGTANSGNTLNIRDAGSSSNFINAVGSNSDLVHAYIDDVRVDSGWASLPSGFATTYGDWVDNTLESGSSYSFILAMVDSSDYVPY